MSRNCRRNISPADIISVSDGVEKSDCPFIHMFTPAVSGDVRSFPFPHKYALVFESNCSAAARG